MKRGRSHTFEEEPSINLTPLIDVVFVILIMFIVVAPLLEMERVELAEAPPLSQPAQQEQQIVMHVFADETLTFNNRPVSLAQLERLLIHAKAKFPAAHPQLFHDRKASFGTYQSVKNAVEAAGFPEMHLLLKPQ